MEAGNCASSPYLPMFETFCAELDEHHERRDRVIKASRDITAASKKIIFALHRVRELREPLPQSIVNSIRPLYEIGSAQFAAVSADLQELNAHRYARQISGGCQEYIEAASFQHYLTTGSLMSYEEAASGMKASDPQGPGVTLSPEDYLLGIYDMTGELMKYAITTMATTGSLPSTGGTGDSRNILADMRGLRLALESLDTGSGPFAREVEKKMNVMQASVEKVERALYGLTVRGAERPKGWMPDTSDSGRVIEVEG